MITVQYHTSLEMNLRERGAPGVVSGYLLWWEEVLDTRELKSLNLKLIQIN